MDMEGGAASDGVNDPSFPSQKICQVEHQNLQPVVEGRSFIKTSEKTPRLTLQVPSKLTNVDPNNYGEFPIQQKVYSQGSSSNGGGGFSHGVSFKNKAVQPDGEKRSLLNPELAVKSDFREGPENAVFANIVARLSWKRCASFPAMPASNLSTTSVSNKEITHSEHTSQKPKLLKKVSRSMSVPVRDIVIVRSGSFPSPTFPSPKDPTATQPPEVQFGPVQMEENDAEIPVEEAVCRICLIGLDEGGSWLTIECSCKGALRLTHEECAVKWFTIRRNNKCEVCGQEVRNLPVTLLRMQSSAPRDNSQQHPGQNSNSLLTRTWQDVVVLILISTMCYFFFLEQLLVNDMRSHAIIIAAPFSLTLGLLGSVFSIVLACREYVWAYSAFQFSLVVIFLHFFYSMLQLKAVFAIMFSSFAGFGVAMGINSFCLQFFAWRARSVQSHVNANPV